MSQILQYYKENTTIGTLDGVYIQTPSLKLDNRKSYGLRVLFARLSSLIPNVYSYGSNDTTRIDISTDGFATVREHIILPNGNYSVYQINVAIQNALTTLGWSTSTASASTPIYLNNNPVTGYNYVRLDTTKLVSGTQVAIDFTADGTSRMNELLGFVTTSIYNTDGLKDASHVPLTDWQGSNINISCPTFAGSTYVNGIPSNVIACLPTSTTMNEIIYPSNETGMISPILYPSIPYIINGFTINITNQRTNQPVVFLFGSANICIEIIQL